MSMRSIFLLAVMTGLSGQVLAADGGSTADFMAAVCSRDNVTSTIRTIQRGGRVIGYRCAIQPSLTDSHIADAGPNPARGHGWHMLAVPAQWDGMVGTYVHLVGSGGKPYAPGSDGATESQALLEDAVSAGYATIALAYSNDTSVRDLCAAYRKTHGPDGNCGGNIREERIYGAGWYHDDPSPLVEVDQHDGIMNRLGKLWFYLTQRGVKAADDDILPFDRWQGVHLGGHSQGAGMSLYIAMRHPTQGACMLAGPYDGPGSSGPFTDWMVEIAPDRFATPVARLRGLIHAKDDGNPIVPLYWRSIGMIRGEHFDLVSKDYPDGPHASVAKEPSLAWARVSACFSPSPAADYVVTPVTNLAMDRHCGNPSTRSVNKAEYLAANPGAVEALRKAYTVRPGTWRRVRVDTMCDYWNGLGAAEKQAARLCIFDDAHYVEAHGLDVPGLWPSGRAQYAQEGYKTEDGVCLPEEIGERSALGY